MIKQRFQQIATVLLVVILCACKKSNVENQNNESNKLVIENVHAWIGYPDSEFFPKIGNRNTDKTINYEYDNTKIVIDKDKNTVRALEPGIYNVKAKVDNQTTTFYVFGFTVDMTSSKFNTTTFDSYSTELSQKWIDEGKDNATTLFIGDSFFDKRNFWTNFDIIYSNEDALCFGIGSTTSYTWEVYLDS